MKHGSLFSGIGGFDLAAEWMGWENVFHCEWNPFGQRVLKHYWPNAKSYNDITKTDFTIHRGSIDILTGGFPCQPYSMAGKRLGKADERHLFPEMLRAIKEIQPRWIIGENVRGLVSWNGGMVFDEVYADLESQGYEVLSFLIPAVAVNAPHRRDRVWFVAYACSGGRNEAAQCGNCYNREQSFCENEQNDWDKIWCNTRDGSKNRDASDTCGCRLEADEIVRKPTRKIDIAGMVSENDASNTACACSGRELQQRSRQGEFGGCDCEGNVANSETNGIYEAKPDTEHADSIGQKRGLHENKSEITIRQQSSQRNARCNGTAAWQNFPSVAPICTGDDGLSDRLDNITFSKWRNESIKAGGNAIVPQVALQIFKTIQQFEHEQNNNRQE